MRAVVQRVSRAGVSVDGVRVGEIGKGLVVLLGVEEGDSGEDLEFMSRKLTNLRIFADAEGKMNCSVKDIGGEILLISQFTLHGDCRKGNRPSFSRAANPADAERLYEALAERIEKEGEIPLFEPKESFSDTEKVAEFIQYVERFNACHFDESWKALEESRENKTLLEKFQKDGTSNKDGKEYSHR